jgi:hypothetical protein
MRTSSTLVIGAALLPLLGAAAPRDVAIANHATTSIVEIYLSAAADPSWGDDRLGQTQVAPGATWRVTPLPAAGCAVDVRVLYADGRAEEKHAVDICRTHDLAFDASNAAAPQAQGSRHVTLENRGPRAIIEAYLSASTSSDWGDDRLHKPLPPGAVTAFDQSGGCVADLRVVYDNRAAEERRRVDICRNQSIAVMPGWTTSEDLAPLDDATAGVRPDHRT